MLQLKRNKSKTLLLRSKIFGYKRRSQGSVFYKMLKYSIILITCLLIIAISFYYSYLASPLDICSNNYCFNFVNIDQYLIIIINLINIFVVISALHVWKKQHNSKHEKSTFQKLLNNIEKLDEHRHGFELIIKAFQKEIKKGYAPDISLGLNYEPIVKKFEELRYSIFDFQIQYNSTGKYLTHFFPQLDHHKIPKTYSKYIEDLDNLYYYLDKKQWNAFNQHHSKFVESNKELHQAYQLLKSTLFNSIYEN